MIDRHRPRSATACCDDQQTSRPIRIRGQCPANSHRNASCTSPQNRRRLPPSPEGHGTSIGVNLDNTRQCLQRQQNINTKWCRHRFFPGNDGPYRVSYSMEQHTLSLNHSNLSIRARFSECAPYLTFKLNHYGALPSDCSASSVSIYRRRAIATLLRVHRGMEFR